MAGVSALTRSSPPYSAAKAGVHSLTRVLAFELGGIEGMTAAEGKALLDFLLEHGNRPEFTFRFRWQKGSIAFWDNRSAKHIALGDTGPFRRLMRRIQVGGAGVPM